MIMKRRPKNDSEIFLGERLKNEIVTMKKRKIDTEGASEQF